MGAVIFIALCVLVVGIVFYIKNNKEEKEYFQVVRTCSVTLKKLELINKKYVFLPALEVLSEVHVYDNEKFYENISCEDYLIYQLQFKKQEIEKQIKNISFNAKNYVEYQKEVSSARRFGLWCGDISGFKEKKLLKIEKRLFENQVKKPATKFNIRVVLECSTMYGRVYLSKTRCFSVGEVLTLIKRIENKFGGYFNDKEIWDAICRVERGRVSNKMRFAIYERDGYRCRMCGRGEREVNLEIDHIKPIAKGGKSTYDNLKTLCTECNKRKGSTYN